jgi:flagellar biosynthesis/type III secretory pathway chaperone
MTIDIAALRSTIERETAALRGFIERLRAEQAALVRGENERVAEFAEAKAACLFELTRLAEERARALTAAGLKADRAGMETLLHKHAAARDAWHTLLKVTETAHQVNTTNGMLIAARLNHTNRALNAIFSAARLPGAYGADGATVSLRTAQQLAVA